MWFGRERHRIKCLGSGRVARRRTFVHGTMATCDLAQGAPAGYGARKEGAQLHKGSSRSTQQGARDDGVGVTTQWKVPTQLGLCGPFRESQAFVMDFVSMNS